MGTLTPKPPPTCFRYPFHDYNHGYPPNMTSSLHHGCTYPMRPALCYVQTARGMSVHVMFLAKLPPQIQLIRMDWEASELHHCLESGSTTGNLLRRECNIKEWKHGNISRIGGGGPEGVSNINLAYFIYIHNAQTGPPQVPTSMNERSLETDGRDKPCQP